MVRAKFRCFMAEQNIDGEGGAAIRLEAVTGGSVENDQFFHYTPSGYLEMGTVNPAAAKEFAVGAEYYIDFTRVDAGVSG